MRIKSGQSWESHGGSWRKVSVELDDHDLRRIVDEGKIKGFILKTDDARAHFHIVNETTGEIVSSEAEFQMLRKEVEKRLIFYMAKDGAISPENAKQQIEAL